MQQLTVQERKHNYLLLLLEAIFFNLGIVFFDSNTILPLLMKYLTGSTILVGLMGVAPALGMGLTSLLAGNLLRQYPCKKSFIVQFAQWGGYPYGFSV